MGRDARRSIRVVIMIVAALALGVGEMRAQAIAGPLMSRDELTALAARSDSLAITGDAAERARSAMIGSAIRQRLRDGDFQVGDRIVVTVVSDSVRRDTLSVRAGRLLELRDKIVIPVAGVLRSELQGRVASEVLKYVKAREIEVTPLMRVGILGEVSHPGYFAFASDLPLTDAIMKAGGPTTGADLEKSIVRRANKPYRSAEETRTAIARGLTLDQFGLNAGDELVVGRRSGVSAGSVIGMVSALGGVLAVLVALRH